MQVDIMEALETPSKERLRLWLRLLKTGRAIETVVRDNFRREFATTLPRFDVMATLSRFEGGLKMSHLSEELRVSNGNVTGIVERLCEDGFLIRVPVAGDRRATLVRLTRRGQEEFQRQASAHEAWVNEMLNDLSPEDARDISQRLEQLETCLDKDRT